MINNLIFQPFFLLTSVFFFTFILSNILYWLYLWQIKEYRLDRLIIHIRETDQGKKLFISVENLIKIGLLIFYLFSVAEQDAYFIYPYLVFVLYFFLFLKTLWKAKNKKLKIPTMTPKVIMIIFISTLFSFILYIYPLLDKYFWLVFIDKIIPYVVASLIGLFAVPSDFYKDTMINKSIQKIREHKDLIIIGITGSYGKGSTKEYLSTILSYKFNVLKTEGTYNTPIGIARTILTGLTSKKEVFVAEMGAYKKGEIAEMSRMVNPTIGILTAVNHQHVSLFGSIENTIEAKYELIESLPREGLALFNGNNQITTNLYRKTKKKKVLYFVSHDKNENMEAEIYAENIKPQKYTLTFDVVLHGKKLGAFTAHLIGAFNIENILPGIYIGSYLGMKHADLKRAVEKISPLKQTMQPFLSQKGTTLIDDTFNANPSSVRVGVEYMKLYSGKKVLVLQPMIELGHEAKKEHYLAGIEIGKNCDYLFLTNKNFLSDIKKGIENSGGECEVSVETPASIRKFILNNLSKNDVVIFEGKEAQNSLRILTPQKLGSAN